MTIKEVLSEYQFRNVGQFRGIAQSLGYSEEYNKGDLLFTRGDDEYRTTIAAVRGCTKKVDTMLMDSSMERICAFFDRDQALSEAYRKTLEKEGVDIVNWGDLKSDAKDRFTVIDHQNKICYTGKELYDYALDNGYLLNGQGTKLEKGVLSELTKVKGKPAKIRLTDNGTSIYYRKEALVIPDSLLGKKLSKKQQQDLLDGNVIVLSTKKGSVFLQVDRDLNSVIIRSEKELAVPAQIGGYKLTTADKYLMANGYSLENKLMKTPQGYIIADVSMTPDKKGFAFSNTQMISETKAKELLQKRIDDSKRDFEAEFKEAVSNKNYEKLSQLKEDGYKPSEEVIKGLGKDLAVDEKQAIVIEKLFGMKPEVQQSADKVTQENKEVTPHPEKLPENYIIKLDKPVLLGDYINSLEQSGIDVSVLHESFPSEDAKSEKLDAFFVMVDNGKVTDWETNVHENEYDIPIKLFSDIEIDKNGKGIPAPSANEFKAALETDNYEKIAQLKDHGYQLSETDKQYLSEIPENKAIAVRKIFGLKTSGNVLGDVKLAQGKPEKDLTRPLTSTLNRAFSDL